MLSPLTTIGHTAFNKTLTHLPLVPATYMHQWIGSAFFQIMACCLFGAKPLSKLIIVNWTLRNKLQLNFNQNTKFFIHEMHLKISSAKWRPFCPRGDELNISLTNCQSEILLCGLSTDISLYLFGQTLVFTSYAITFQCLSDLNLVCAFSRDNIAVIHFLIPWSFIGQLKIRCVFWNCLTHWAQWCIYVIKMDHHWFR